MDYKNIILTEIQEWLFNISDEDIDNLISLISKSSKIICFGAGRMGISLRAFSMRLNHLGKESYFYDGSNYIPPVDENDLFLFASGSGKTSTVLNLADIASKRGCKISCITGDDKSPLALKSDVIVKFKACTGGLNYEDDGSKIPSKQIMSTLNEQGIYLLCDLISLKYKDIFSTDEKVRRRHCNVE